MLGPRSFTGEDVVEIHCHGGALITDRALRALLAAGARAARPGEFTERAFLNGKLDLCQAEAVADLIEASSDAGRAAAWQHLAGALSQQVVVLRDAILDARALVEAHLDFPEDELPDGRRAGDHLRARRRDRQDRVADRHLRARPPRTRRDPGRARGQAERRKVLTADAILGRERALVSTEAGTTRDYLEEPVALGALRLLLCDTAGLRDDASTIERAGIERTRDVMATSDVVVVVLDASRPLDAMDRAALAASGESAADRGAEQERSRFGLAGRPVDAERVRAHRDRSRGPGRGDRARSAFLPSRACGRAGRRHPDASSRSPARGIGRTRQGPARTEQRARPGHRVVRAAGRHARARSDWWARATSKTCSTASSAASALGSSRGVR